MGQRFGVVLRVGPGMNTRRVLALLLAALLVGCAGEGGERERWQMDEWKSPRHEGEFGRIRSWGYQL